MLKTIKYSVAILTIAILASCGGTKNTGDMIIGKWKTADYQNTALTEEEKILFEEEKDERIKNDIYSFQTGTATINNGSETINFKSAISEDQKKITLTAQDNTSFEYEIVSISETDMNLNLKLEKGAIKISLKKTE